MHSLSSAFVLGYHGCDSSTADRLLRNESFIASANEYDWLGSGIYFWEANPDRALDWARQLRDRRKAHGENDGIPSVVGAVIDPGYCLDLVTSNGTRAVETAYSSYEAFVLSSGAEMPSNSGGIDPLLRELDCAVINYIHGAREQNQEPPFDTVRGVFIEGDRLYKHSGFFRKTHIQICVRNPDAIKGVFRVPAQHFSPENLT